MEGKPSFWTTLPGLLTGIAAVLTAAATLTGVIIAVDRDGDSGPVATQTDGGTTDGGTTDGGTTDGGTTDGGTTTSAEDFVGEWRNVDPATRSTTRYVIELEGETLMVWGYGSCTPTECDWAGSVGGPRTAPASDADDGAISIVWDFGFKTQEDEMELEPDGVLRVVSSHDYNDERTDRVETQRFRRT